MKKSILFGVFICFFALLVSCSSGIKFDETVIPTNINPPSWIIGTWTGVFDIDVDFNGPVDGYLVFEKDDFIGFQEDEYYSYKEDLEDDLDIDCISKTSSTLFILTLSKPDDWKEELIFTKISNDTMSFIYNKYEMDDNDVEVVIDSFGASLLTKI